MDYLRLTWTDIESACREISYEIKDQGLSDHTLIGIARGGLVPLRLISDKLGSRNISTMALRFYDGIHKRKIEPSLIHPVQGDIAGRDIILIDDISDTGRSLVTAKKHLSEKGAKDIIVATISKKPGTELIPDIFVKETSSWVIYPWEVLETARKIINKTHSYHDALVELESACILENEYKEILKRKKWDKLMK